MNAKEPVRITAQNAQQLEEKSLLGSAFSFNDKGHVSTQSLADLQSNDDDD